MSKVEFDKCECVAETDGAILVEVPELEREVWIPKSQVDDDSEVYKKGTEGVLVISEWIATKRGMV